MSEGYVPNTKRPRRTRMRVEVAPPANWRALPDDGYVEGLVRDRVTREVLEDVLQERRNQFARYGSNADLEDGTGPETRWLGPYTNHPATSIEIILRGDYDDYVEETGKPTWTHLIREEVAEAFKESDGERLESELIQVAALAVSWIEKIRARRS